VNFLAFFGLRRTLKSEFSLKLNWCCRASHEH